MKKFRIFLLALAMVLLGTGALHAQLRTDDLVIQTATGKNTFHVEIADTDASREQGLMFRKSMAADHGMLFEFDHPMPVMFWMKNTLIPLDMVFIGQKGDVVSIVKNDAPESTDPVGTHMPVTGVLEINGGLSDKLGIKSGDRVIYPFFQ